MANWFERFLGKREGIKGVSDASSSTGWTDEFPRADAAAERARAIAITNQERREAALVAERDAAIESMARDLNERALKIRATLKADIEKAISEGKTEISYLLVQVPKRWIKETGIPQASFGWSLKFPWELITSSASEFQSLLDILNRNGYEVKIENYLAIEKMFLHIYFENR